LGLEDVESDAPDTVAAPGPDADIKAVLGRVALQHVAAVGISKVARERCFGEL
jgi:hypothetical protein